MARSKKASPSSTTSSRSSSRSKASGSERTSTASTPTSPPKDTDASSEAEEDMCLICTETVEIYAIGPCNHTVCHKCSLRLRELYQQKSCYLCKIDQPLVIFTYNGARTFQSFSEREWAARDEAMGIVFEYSEMYQDAKALLRFNCPDLGCDAIANSWGALAKHTRSVHQLFLCEICTKNKKVFPHEHTLFTRKALATHYAGSDEKEHASSGFRGHPLCAFCGQRFYDDEALYVHCRDKHEQCHLCVRELGANKAPWYENYSTLFQHFKRDHYVCQDPGCLERKFVVFSSNIDLTAHQNFEHTAPGSGQRANKNRARQVALDFNYHSNSSARSSEEGEGGGAGTSSGPRGNRRRPGGEAGTSRRPQVSRQADPGVHFASASGMDITPSRSSGISIGPSSEMLSEEGGAEGTRGRDHPTGGSQARSRLGAPEGFGQLTTGPSASGKGKSSRRRKKKGVTPEEEQGGQSSSPFSTQPSPLLDEHTREFCHAVLRRCTPPIPPSIASKVQEEFGSFYGIRKSAATLIDSLVELLLPYLQRLASSANSNDLVQQGKRSVGALVKAAIVELGVNDERAIALHRAWNEHLAIISQFPELQSSDFYTSSTLGRSSRTQGGGDQTPPTTWGGGQRVLNVKQQSTAHSSTGVWQRVAEAAQGRIPAAGTSPSHRPSQAEVVAGGPSGGSRNLSEAFPALPGSSSASTFRNGSSPLTGRGGGDKGRRGAGGTKGRGGGDGGRSGYSTAWSLGSQPHRPPLDTYSPSSSSSSSPSPSHVTVTTSSSDNKGKAPMRQSDFPSLPEYVPTPRPVVSSSRRNQELGNAWGVTPTRSPRPSTSPSQKGGKGKGKSMVLRIG